MGRGCQIISMLQSLPPSATKAAPPSDISSTSDALAQLHFERHEEVSSLSESKTTKGEAEAAAFMEVPEEVLPEKRGTAGMSFVCSNDTNVKIYFCIGNFNCFVSI